MKNIERATGLLKVLSSNGIRDYVVCPGARNSPLVSLLSKATGIRVFQHFEERAAAFFSVGRARAMKRPVAVVTTSGTAAAELLPAVMEAHYSCIPLVLVTADRPRRFRGSGGPQCVEQVGLFWKFAPPTLDIDGDALAHLSGWNGSTPLHVNICFDEPLIDGAVPQMDMGQGDSLCRSTPTRSKMPVQRIVECLAQARSPLAIIGGLDPCDREGVVRLLQRFAAPIYAEATSGIREDERLQKFIIHSGERSLQSQPWDGVLRIGAVPVTRFWRDLERKKEIPVVSISPHPFSGLARESVLIEIQDVDDVGEFSPFPQRLASHDFLGRDREEASRLCELYSLYPQAEPALVHELSRRIPIGSRVYLGNSLPIREWDLAATFEKRNYEIGANRGVNGIDGQISTFLGWCEAGRENWAIVGDLTALYDLSAPWMLKQMGEPILRIVVINNGGGKIFARMFDDPLFQNHHAISFESWAKLWGCAYERWECIPRAQLSERHCIIELIPDEGQTQDFWDAYERAGSPGA